MPTRILLRLTLLAGLVMPLRAFALGVGPLDVRSALNQNFEAEIPLIVNNPAELTGLTVQVPRQQDFDRIGVERLAFLSKLRFSVQAPPGGPNIIKITSVEPVREPNFNLLLELVWSRGRLLREFPVQLDPELYANRRQPPPPQSILALPPIAAAPAATAPAAAPLLPPAPPVSFEGASLYGPVRSGETLMAVANRARPSTAVSLPQMMAILVAGNPEAFVNGNPNTLRAGSMLKVPTPQALGAQGVTTPPLASEPATATTLPATTGAISPPSPPATEPSAPPVPVVTPPPPVEPAAPPVTPSTVATLPPTPEVSSAPAPTSAELPREIVPQASLPQTPTTPTSAETPKPAPTAATQPESPPVTQPPPVPAKPPVAQLPTPAEEAEFDWLVNPVVWIAIALIVLAVGSMLLLPMLRRSARPKPVVEAKGKEVAPPSESTDTSELPVMPPTRVQMREPRTRRVQPIAADSITAAAAVPSRIEPASEPVNAPPQPKPIDELLKDIDFSLGEDQLLPLASGGSGALGRNIETPRLPDAEPATASVVREPSPLAQPSLSFEKPEAQIPPPPKSREELPSELRLDNLNFDFDNLGFEKTARTQTELPPLEMKPAAPGPKLTELSPLDLGATQPMAAPSPVASVQAASAKPAEEPVARPATDLKFEFTDVTQEYGKPGARREASKLDEELRGFDDTLDLGKMGFDAPGGGDTGSEYVETKLDLATAYLDMGDQVGARSLLEDVLREGDDSQKKRAGELLKKLG